MRKMRRTLFTLMTITLLLGVSPSVAYAKGPENNFDGICPFCDGDELTLKEKYEELIVKALIDAENRLDDGFITKEVYLLQCEPFEKALDSLDSATEEEIRKGYESILIYFFDELSEEEAEGEEIDEEFLQYLLEQLEEYEVQY